jgi:nucleotide-binding universal stress UspA family protein
MAAFRTILHPTDFSPASRAAFTRAVALTKENRATLIVAHVLVPSAAMIGDGYVSPAAYEAIEAAARGGAQKGLARLAARARKAGVRVRTLLLHGLAHEEIARAARARRADLIVMGTHGRTGVGRLFLGSVAERVVARAPCPVLTVRGGARRARR